MSLLDPCRTGESEEESVARAIAEEERIDALTKGPDEEAAGEEFIVRWNEEQEIFRKLDEEEADRDLERKRRQARVTAEQLRHMARER